LRDVTLRKEYDEEIQKLNENLERLVERRTEQLAAANRELETFAYSVSHDLRAPLRGIHANASILKEELGPRLSPSDEETIDRILARATEMSNLIDGLLKISRIMRTELQREDIDLTALSKEAFDRVRRWHPERIIQFTVPAGLATKGDRVLLLAALTNLFDNAIKFTVHQPEARIEMNATVEDFETVYWVSDNGVGFDMEHAGKLFRPFERLHSGDEFAGTGIGLATVQRVVQRHGGRIWAEGKVGGGATFYFTLGPASESPRDSILESRRESVSGTEFGADGRQTDTEP
jgi:light-regulated signal transduction histidine kinase (bacteriophytochrome)